MTQQLARRASWKQLEGAVFTKSVQRFAAAFGLKISQKKLGQAVPIAGIAVGAGINYRTLDRTFDAAYWAYRRRFLVEKYPNLASDLEAEIVDLEAEQADAERAAGSTEETVLSVLDIVEVAQHDVAATEGGDQPR